MSDLNKKNINYGGLNRFLQNLRSHDLSGLATEEYVDDAIAEIPEYSAGSNISISDDNEISCTYQYSLPTASSSTLGGVKVGSGLAINNGVLTSDVKTSDIQSLQNFVQDADVSISNLINTNSIPELKEYLTFEAKEDNCSIYFGTYDSGYTKTIEISTDKVTWTEKTSSRFTSGSTTDGTLLATLNTGDVLYVRGNNSSYATDSAHMHVFYATKQCYMYGNVMSLIQKDNFWEVKELERMALWGLFGNVYKSSYTGNLYSHPTKQIFISANSLKYGACKYLFMGCSNITSFVILATIFADAATAAIITGAASGTIYKSPIINALPSDTLPSGWNTENYYDNTLNHLVTEVAGKANKVDFVIPINMQTQVADWTVLNTAAEGIYRVKVAADMMGTSVTMLEGWATVTNSMGTIAQTLVLTQMIPNAQGSPLTIHNRVSANSGTTWADYEFNLGVINDNNSSSESTYSSSKINSLISALEARINVLEGNTTVE